MVKWWVCYFLCQDRRLQLLPGVCCGSGSSVWVGELAGNTRSTWAARAAEPEAALQIRPVGARSEQEPVKVCSTGAQAWACPAHPVPPGSLPCCRQACPHSWNDRMCCILCSWLLQEAACKLCLHPARGKLPFQSAWGYSSSGSFLHSLAQSLGPRSLHSVSLMSLSSQETWR